MEEKRNPKNSWAWATTFVSKEIGEPKLVVAKHDWFWIIFAINFCVILYILVLSLVSFPKSYEFPAFFLYAVKYIVRVD